MFEIIHRIKEETDRANIPFFRIFFNKYSQKTIEPCQRYYFLRQEIGEGVRIGVFSEKDTCNNILSVV